jgi:hypothetical protein
MQEAGRVSSGRAFPVRKPALNNSQRGKTFTCPVDASYTICIP